MYARVRLSLFASSLDEYICESKHSLLIAHYVRESKHSLLIAHYVRESSSVVERFLAKEEVAGSSPVSRSRKHGAVAKVVTAPV